MEKKVGGRMEGDVKLYLGYIFILLACFNLVGLLNLNGLIVFCFTLGAFLFVLADFFRRFVGVFLFLGLLSIVGLPLILNPQVLPEIRKFLDERSMLLFTIGLAFINLYFAEPKKRILEKKLEVEYERGKLEMLENVKKEILNK